MEDPSQVLHEVGLFGLVLEMQSRSKLNVWHTMYVGFEQYDCANSQSRCKHMLALKKMFQKLLQCMGYYKR